MQKSLDIYREKRKRPTSYLYFLTFLVVSNCSIYVYFHFLQFASLYSVIATCTIFVSKGRSLIEYYKLILILILSTRRFAIVP